MGISGPDTSGGFPRLPKPKLRRVASTSYDSSRPPLLEIDDALLRLNNAPQGDQFNASQQRELSSFSFLENLVFRAMSRTAENAKRERRKQATAERRRKYYSAGLFARLAPTPKWEPPVNPINRADLPPVSGIDYRLSMNGPLATVPQLLNIFDVPDLPIPYRVTLITTKGVMAPRSARNASEPLCGACKVVLGDLHGSYLKLMETLVLSGMVSMPEAAARRFVWLANHPWNTSKSVSQLTSLYLTLAPVLKTMKWTGGNAKLVLIGDVLSDRGLNDSVTLAIIAQLRGARLVQFMSKQAPVQYVESHPERVSWIVGNHDHNIVERNISDEYMRSFLTAKKVARLRGPFETAVLENQYCHYLMQAKLMDYDPASKTVYAHAPITGENVAQLIGWLNQRAAESLDCSEAESSGFLKAYEDMRSEEDVQTLIARANQEYTKYITRCYSSDAREEDLEWILGGWRNEKGFLWNHSPLNNAADLPFAHCGVKRIVHGHITLSQESPFSVDKKPNGRYVVVNLDQDARRSFENDLEHPQGYPPDESRMISRLYIE